MNIFYSEVDQQLQLELDARAAAGTKNRSERDLNFMLGKIANVEISAFEGENAQTPVIQTLGGINVREGRYLPGGASGFLNETPYEQKSIEYNAKTNTAASRTVKLNDSSYRTGPYISTANITIGDHSMGLLNKATVNIKIPNPLRDLDVIETVWFRPGRYARISMMHPDSAVITRTDTKTYPNSPGLLSKTTIPNREKLKQFYPYLTKSTKDIEEFETKLRKMNHVMFEGVITSFKFSYTKDGTIEASISLTGTSNIYTDISMFMPTPDNVKQSPKEQESKPKAPVNPVLDPKIDLTKRNSILDELINSSIVTKVDADSLRNLTGESLKNRAKQLNISDDTINRLLETERDQSASAFYDALNIKFPIPDVAKFNGLPALLEKLKPEVTDQFYLVGEPYNNFSRTEYASKTNPLLNNLRLNRGIRTQAAPTLEQVSTSNIIPDVAVNFYRYITLGALIEFLNTYILTKLDNTVSNAKILCSDERCYSTYYSEMVSANPWEVLFLDTTNKHNRYGTTTFFDTTKIKDIKEWKGCYGNYRQVLNTDTFTSADTVFFPSRIFISLETIKEIIMGTDGKSGLSSGGKSSFTVKSFLTNISAKISQATGNAILLSLVTEPDPSFQSTLLFVDSKYVSRMDNEKNKAVVPYSIPMFANNSKGTLIRDFTLAAQLPENAKSLAYTLNGADKDGFEDEIAPYLNFMYQQNNADEINNTLKRYKENHKTIQVSLNVAKIDFGAFPKNPEKQAALRNTLIKYIKYPTDDIKLSSLMTAPIFPFTAEFTIDGINGFRYGDVLQFEALPKRYRINTVFSVISVTHTVSENGEWTTQVQCIMRPSLE